MPKSEQGIGALSEAAGGLVRDAAAAEAANFEAAGLSVEVEPATEENPSSGSVETDQPSMEERKTSE